MRYRPYFQCILAVFCLLPLSLGECGSKGENKSHMTTDLKQEKTVETKYPFDFPDLSDEVIRRDYIKVNYNIHKNKLFNFSVLMNKNWDGLKVAEPAQLPMDGSLAEIGLFNLYSPFHDRQGDLTAQLLIYITAVPKETSAADYLDKQIPLMLKDQKFETIQSKKKDTNLGPTKDTLISYSFNGTPFLSRLCAFKVEDDTKTYVFDEKHLLYLIQMSMPEKDYEKFGAEAFYLSKVSFYLE